MDNEILIKLAQVLRAQDELKKLQENPPKSVSRGIEKKAGVLYVPPGRTGQSLKRVSDMTEEEVKEFKAKNLRHRAMELRETALYNLNQAMKLEKEAQELCPLSDDCITEFNQANMAQILHRLSLEYNPYTQEFEQAPDFSSLPKIDNND